MLVHLLADDALFNEGIRSVILWKAKRDTSRFNEGGDFHGSSNGASCT